MMLHSSIHPLRLAWWAATRFCFKTSETVCMSTLLWLNTFSHVQCNLASQLGCIGHAANVGFLPQSSNFGVHLLTVVSIVRRSLNPCTFNSPGNASSNQVTGSDCWEELSVSNSSYSKYKLTDGQSNTYWESAAEVGKNWIHIKMKPRNVIRLVVLLRTYVERFMYVYQLPTALS